MAGGSSLEYESFLLKGSAQGGAARVSCEIDAHISHRTRSHKEFFFTVASWMLDKLVKWMAGVWISKCIYKCINWHGKKNSDILSHCFNLDEGLCFFTKYPAQKNKHFQPAKVRARSGSQAVYAVAMFWSWRHAPARKLGEHYGGEFVVALNSWVTRKILKW